MSETPERWEKSGPFDHNGNPWEEDAAGEGSWPMWPILNGNFETIAECWDERYADLICALHNDRAALADEARFFAEWVKLHASWEAHTLAIRWLARYDALVTPTTEEAPPHAYGGD